MILSFELWTLDFRKVLRVFFEGNPGANMKLNKTSKNGR